MSDDSGPVHKDQESGAELRDLQSADAQLIRLAFSNFKYSVHSELNRMIERVSDSFTINGLRFIYDNDVDWSLHNDGKFDEVISNRTSARSKGILNSGLEQLMGPKYDRRCLEDVEDALWMHRDRLEKALNDYGEEIENHLDDLKCAFMEDFAAILLKQMPSKTTESIHKIIDRVTRGHSFPNYLSTDHNRFVGEYTQENTFDQIKKMSNLHTSVSSLQKCDEALSTELNTLKGELREVKLQVQKLCEQNEQISELNQQLLKSKQTSITEFKMPTLPTQSDLQPSSLMPDISLGSPTPLSTPSWNTGPLMSTSSPVPPPLPMFLAPRTHNPCPQQQMIYANQDYHLPMQPVSCHQTFQQATPQIHPDNAPVQLPTLSAAATCYTPIRQRTLSSTPTLPRPICPMSNMPRIHGAHQQPRLFLSNKPIGISGPVKNWTPPLSPAPQLAKPAVLKTFGAIGPLKDIARPPSPIPQPARQGPLKAFRAISIVKGIARPPSPTSTLSAETDDRTVDLLLRNGHKSCLQTNTEGLPIDPQWKGTVLGLKTWRRDEDSVRKDANIFRKEMKKAGIGSGQLN
jgi:hypothetical protein